MTTTSLYAVGCYRRDSMKEQPDGFSLEDQAKNIHKYASKWHWKLIQIYPDAGLSVYGGSFVNAWLSTNCKAS